MYDVKSYHKSNKNRSQVVYKKDKNAHFTKKNNLV